MHFTPVADGLYRLDIPFDHLYTSVFLLTGEENIIIDAATTRSDVYGLILPALAEMGIEKASLLLTHRHGDHSGGAPFLSQALEGITLLPVRAGQTVGRVTAIPVGGHTEDSLGYYDAQTGTLLCGDGLQFFGVGKYGCSIVDASLYEATLSRVRALGAHAILPSHDFIGGSASAVGEESVTALLDAAQSIWEEIKAFILSHPADSDPFEVVRAWKDAYPSRPPLPSITVKAVRAL